VLRASEARRTRGDSSQILAAVQSEFDVVRKELRVQLERMAQIQRQLDSIERILTKLVSKGEA